MTLDQVITTINVLNGLLVSNTLTAAESTELQRSLENVQRYYNQRCSSAL